VLRTSRPNEDRIVRNLSTEKYHPDRIIIESSGSAFPATLAFQIRDLERETSNALSLDAIVTVIDAENFTGYEDTSVTARMQAQYTDVLLINKWEHISERALDNVLDHLYTLNEHTPKIRCAGKSIDPALIFGVDSKLFRDGDDSLPLSERTPDVSPHHDEVETVTLLRGGPALPAPAHEHGHHDKAHACDHPPLSHPHPEGSTAAHSAPPLPPLDEPTLSSALRQLPKESVYRVKGFIRFTPTPTAGAGADSDHEGDARRQPWWILNWAFGRWDLVRASTSPFATAEDGDEREIVRLTVMGERGEVRRSAKKLAAALGAAVVN